MDDFFKGYSQGMTGSTGGNPSQSVLEKMGRDAASNQWNGNSSNRQTGSGNYAGTGRPGTPITKIICDVSREMGWRKIVRNFIIGVGLMILSMVVHAIVPRSLEWLGYIPAVPGWLIIMWAILQSAIFLLGSFFGLFYKKEPESEA